MVQDHERLEAGTNSFVGMAYRELEGKPGEYGFVVLDEVVKVPYRVEYVQALLAGDLLPADDATATAVGLKTGAPTKAAASPKSKDGDR
jgi:hypothetical protein